ncbi:MAG: AraC family transcriptional regulator [Victivallaceae bacterium]|nr:AraC family transcriptional regulator [Victivallaceae bacterium]
MDQKHFIEKLGNKIKLISANMMIATPFQSTNTHLHPDELHISYTVKGRGYCYVNGKRYILTPGTIHMVFPNEVHKYQPDANNPYTVYFIHINWGGEIPALNRIIKIRKKHSLNSLFKKITDLCWNVFSPTAEIRKYALLSLILSELLDISLTQPTASDRTELPPGADNKLAIAIARLGGPPFKFPGIEKLAELTGMSKRSFINFFRRQTGMSAMEYFLRNKMAYAKNLLASNELTKKEIAFQCGYHNTQNFTRAFRIFSSKLLLPHIVPENKE